MKTTPDFPAPLFTFHNLEPAVALQDRLIVSGVPATIRDESKLQRYWFISKPLAAVHVDVPESYYADAKKTVEEWDKTDRCLSEAVRCPECFSSHVEFPQMTRKFVTPSLLLTLFALLGLVKRRFYCADCHYTWPVAEDVDTRRHVPGFPLDSDAWDANRARRHH